MTADALRGSGGAGSVASMIEWGCPLTSLDVIGLSAAILDFDSTPSYWSTRAWRVGSFACLEPGGHEGERFLDMRARMHGRTDALDAEAPEEGHALRSPFR